MAEVKMVGEKCALYENTILQGLDQFLVQDDGHQCYYPVSAFEPTVDKWVGIPIVYDDGAEHPVPEKFKDNPKAALAATHGRIVGMVSGAEVIKQDTGKPHLKISMNVCDEEANGLFHDAKLGISSAFTCSSKSNKTTEVITGNIVPNHVLLFPRDPLSGVDQRDAAAMVNTQFLEVSNLEDKLNVGKQLSGENRGVLQEVHDHCKNAVSKLAGLLAKADTKQSDDYTDDADNGSAENCDDKKNTAPVAVIETHNDSATQGMDMDKLQELEAKVNSLADATKAKDERIATLEQVNSEMAEKMNAVKAREEAEQKAAFLNTLKPGVVKEHGDALYEEFKANPVGFLNTHKLDLAVGGETRPEGAVVAKVLDENEVKVNSMPKDKVLNFNKRTHNWELI